MPVEPTLYYLDQMKNNILHLVRNHKSDMQVGSGDFDIFSDYDNKDKEDEEETMDTSEETDEITEDDNSEDDNDTSSCLSDDSCVQDEEKSTESTSDEDSGDSGDIESGNESYDDDDETSDDTYSDDNDYDKKNFITKIIYIINCKKNPQEKLTRCSRLLNEFHITKREYINLKNVFYRLGMSKKDVKQLYNNMKYL